MLEDVVETHSSEAYNDEVSIKIIISITYTVMQWYVKCVQWTSVVVTAKINF